MEIQLLLAVGLGIALLLFLILKLKIQAFLALLIVCIFVGILAGMPAGDIMETMKEVLSQMIHILVKCTLKIDDLFILNIDDASCQ